MVELPSWTTSPDPAAVERAFLLSLLNIADDTSLSISDLRDRTGAGASVESAVRIGDLTYPDIKSLLTDISRNSILPINVKTYGAVGNNITDDTSNINRALADALAQKRSLYFPSGSYKYTGNLNISTQFDLLGDGVNSVLNITNGGVIVDATSGFIQYSSIKDLRIKRLGTVAGPALHLKGAGNGTGVARILGSNVRASSVLGEALLYEGSYIGTFVNCFFESSVYGIRGIRDAATSIVGTNAVTFIGGESNGNQNGWLFDRPSGVSMFGFTTEGNLISGGKITGVARGFTYEGGYFELNNGPDIEVDCSAGSGGIVIAGNIMYCVGTSKSESILLRRGRVAVNNNVFNGLNDVEGDIAIRINEGSSPVFGEARNNLSMKGDNTDVAPVIEYTSGGAAFNVTQLGQVTKSNTDSITSSTLNDQAGVSWMRKVSQVLDFPSIPANSEASLTVLIPGAIITDDVTVSGSIIEDGLILKSWGVTAPDTITIRLRNVTAAAIDPAPRSYRIRVWR